MDFETFKEYWKDNKYYIIGAGAIVFVLIVLALAADGWVETGITG